MALQESKVTVWPGYSEKIPVKNLFSICRMNLHGPEGASPPFYMADGQHGGDGVSLHSLVSGC